MATATFTDDDRTILAAVRRDRIARERPKQLEERALLAALAPPPDKGAIEKAKALDADLATAERDVDATRVALARTLNRVSELRRNRHGRTHAETALSEGNRRRLEALAHPIIRYVRAALVKADLACCAVAPSILGIEHVDESVPDPEAARSWWNPASFTRRTSRPKLSTNYQEQFTTALRAARQRVEDLPYQPLDDDASVVCLREEIDALVAMVVPGNLLHVRDDLVALRRVLDRAPLDLWQIDDRERSA